MPNCTLGPPKSPRHTRRTFVASVPAVAVVGAASTLTSSSASAQSTSKHNYIDAHSHIWTRDVKSYPLAKGQTVNDLDPPSFTAEELLRVAQPEGVSRVVLIAHQIYYGFDNRYMIDAAKAHPGTFKIVGMVDDTSASPDAQMRRLLPLQVTGFRISPRNRGDRWLAGEGMHAMWKCAAETGQAMCCLINPPQLAQVDQMCRTHTATQVVIDHFARVGIDGTIRERELQQLCDLAKNKNVVVKVSAYYALGNKKQPHHELIPMIRRVLDAYGPERLMWASDCPYQLQGDNSYSSSISLVRDQLDSLSTGDKDWLLRKTAEKIFGFDA